MCFAAGTLIATPEGERRVESLVAGERVTLHDGASAEIVWVGRRRLRTAGHPKPGTVHPVRIRAHAFGEGLPRRDLLVSPGHGLFFADALGERLIPAFRFVNGTTVVQETVAEVDYVHVELARHDILLAEGLPAESYLEVGGRADFEAAGAAVSLYPTFSTMAHEAARAPFVLEGPLVEPVRRRLAGAPRAGRLNWLLRRLA